jgi:putative mRNA 3-end processing factor
MAKAQDWLKATPGGLVCEPGGFTIDPTAPVERAVITHGHGDHARPGSTHVLATSDTLEIMRTRFGPEAGASLQPLDYGDWLELGGVNLAFAPAGHVLGSAQVVMEYAGQRVVVSGDYKRRPDPTCVAFEPVGCDLFITEATFGLPVFRHPDDAGEIAKLLESLRLFPERTHLVGAYVLGKAQRVMALLRDAGYGDPIYVHGAMEKVTRYYQDCGIDLGRIKLARGAGKLAGAIVLCPPSTLKDLWSRRFAEPLTCLASGFMRVRARARQHLVELPLVISDHADWDGLTSTIRATGAAEVWVTHGQEDALVHWSITKGLRARPLDISGYGEEDDTDAATASADASETA